MTRLASSTRLARTGSLVAFALSSVACSQPEPVCSVSSGIFAARYELVEGEGDCAGLTGELLGVAAYAQPFSKSDPRPNYKNASIGIQPQSLTDLLGASAGVVEPEAGDAPYGLGKFASSKPKRDLCSVPTLSEARLRLPEIPEQQVDECTTAPAQDPVDVSYVFENVEIVASAQNYGTKLTADLTYTFNGCTAKYKVKAVYPAVACDAQSYPEPEPIETDENGDPICPAPSEPLESLPNDDLCSPVANPELGLAAGSGISADFPVECDPVLLHCVLK
jgi:hypothetical protein